MKLKLQKEDINTIKKIESKTGTDYLVKDMEIDGENLLICLSELFDYTNKLEGCLEDIKYFEENEEEYEYGE